MNYEGYIANLLNIVDELRNDSSYPEEIDRVTPEAIAFINRIERKDSDI